MKKRFHCLLPVLLLALGITAQAGGEKTRPAGGFVLESQAHAPRSGDFLIKSPSVWMEPGKKGENITWDFSKSSVTGEEHPVNYFTTGGNNITSGEDATYFRYLFSGDSLLLTGYENTSMLVRYEQPALLLKFPLSYNSKTSGTYYGRGKYCDRLEYLFSGSIETSADGYGTLILPKGDTLRNVIRVHTKDQKVERYLPLTPNFDINAAFDIESISDTLVKSLHESGYVETDRYQWYSEGSRYPVFEMVESRKLDEQNVSMGTQTEKLLTRTAYLFNPKEQRQQLPEDQANQPIQKPQPTLKTDNPTGIQDVAIGQDIRIYPNPVVDNLNVTMQLSQKQLVQVFLYDMQGRAIYKSRQQQREGSFTENITMGHLTQGNYVLRVQVGDKSEKKVIVKQ